MAMRIGLSRADQESGVNQNFIENAITMVMPAALASGLFVSRATFQAPSQVFDAAGAWSGTWADVDGLVHRPCYAPPPSDARIQATENKALEEIVSAEWHHVLLSAWYPQVDAGWRGDGSPAGAWRIMIDGFPYEICGVESDGHSVMTRVTAKLSTI
jgi:hypothetical protein